MSMTIDAVKLIMEWQKDPKSELYIKPDEFETVNIAGFNDPLYTYDGTLLLKDITNISGLKNLELRNDDTFIIGFPKSGIYKLL